MDNTLSTGELLSDFDVEKATTGSAAVSVRLLDDPCRRAARTASGLSSRLPQSGSAAELDGPAAASFERNAAADHGPARSLPNLLQANDFDGLAKLLRSVFASIPYQWHTKNDIADYEGYYASVFYALFAAQDFDVTAEDSTSHGRLDMTVVFSEQVFLFEFKVVASRSEGEAIAQLRERNYVEKYRGRGWPIHLIGVEFSKETRTLVGFEAVPDQPAPTKP